MTATQTNNDARLSGSSEAKTSPGPWKFYSKPFPEDGELIKHDVCVFDETGRTIIAREWFSGDDEFKAHVAEDEIALRLIAAAPELLEALRAICDTANQSQVGTRDRLLSIWKMAMAAIAKAEGNPI